MLLPDDGFVKIYRKITSWDWYDDPNTFRLFVHCILKANYKEKEWHGITIPVGSFVTSYAKLAKELKLSKKEIRIALDHLKTTQEVAHESTTQYSIITVKNYKKYQQTGTQNGTQGAHEGHTEGTRGATTKERKNERKKEYSYDNIFKKLEEKARQEGRLRE